MGGGDSSTIASVGSIERDVDFTDEGVPYDNRFQISVSKDNENLYPAAREFFGSPSKEADRSINVWRGL